MVRIIIILFFSITSLLTQSIIAEIQTNDTEITEIFSTDAKDTTWETIYLFPRGNFELKEGENPSSVLSWWHIPTDEHSVQISLDAQTFLAGKYSLKIQAEKNFSISTGINPIPQGTFSINASISINTKLTPTISIKLFQNETLAKTIDFKPIKTNNPDFSWTRYILPETEIIGDINSWQLQISAEINEPQTLWIDEINITAFVEQKKQVDILVNQVGYDLLCPKSCVIATNFKPESLQAVITDKENNQLYTLRLSEPTRIISANHSDWGKWFIQGDFSEFNQEGTFHVTVIIDKDKFTSHPFIIGKDIIWSKTLPIALEGIRSQRYGDPHRNSLDAELTIKNDNERTILCGWHNGDSESTTKTALILHYLAESYLICTWRLSKSPELEKTFADELQWGAQCIIQRFNEQESQTSSTPLEGSSTNPPSDITIEQNQHDDEDISASALAYVANIFKSQKPNPYADTVEKMLHSLSQRKVTSHYVFSAYVLLAEIKGYDNYLQTIKEIFPQQWFPASETIIRFDSAFDGTKFFELVQLLEKTIQPLIEQSKQNPFGICPIQSVPEPTYFSPTKGNNQHLLNIAILAGKLFRYKADESIRKLFFDHINWLLGVNPFGICFLHGAGHTHLQRYYRHNSTPNNPTETPKGIIPHGIIAYSKTNDTPYLELSLSDSPDPRTHGISIETTALYINALAHYNRVRLHPEENPNPYLPPDPTTTKP